MSMWEWHTDQLSAAAPPNSNHVKILGKCPDRESNLQPFGALDSFHPAETYQSGLPTQF